MVRRTKSRPSPPSRTLTFARLTSTQSPGQVTSNVTATSSAGSQFWSPAWEATTVTVPVPLNVRRPPDSSSVAGPATTA